MGEAPRKASAQTDVPRTAPRGCNFARCCRKGGKGGKRDKGGEGDLSCLRVVTFSMLRSVISR